MTKQPEDWLDDVPGDDIEDEDDEIIWVSKSEIKRDAEELKRLGAEIVDLGKNALDKIPLDADLRAAIIRPGHVLRVRSPALIHFPSRCSANDFV